MLRMLKTGLCLLLVQTAVAQTTLTFDDQFENGRLDTAFAESQTYRLWPVSNIHARVIGTTGQTPVFSIFDSVGFQLRSYHHMVYRYEGQQNWQTFDTAYKSGTQSYYTFQNLHPFTADTIYIAYWAPYTYTDLNQYLQSIQSDTVVEVARIGSSVEGRSLYAVEVTDFTYLDCYKKEVIITARQHPTENINGYFVEGMINYLRSGTQHARQLLRGFRFVFYPMCNPDGVYKGLNTNVLGQGLNREWADTTHPGGTPEVDSIKAHIYEITQGSFDFGIDVHGNAGSNLPYYWWGFTPSSGVDSVELWQAEYFVQQVQLLDSSSRQNGSLFQNYIQGNGVSSSMTAANWFHHSCGAIAYTFEPTSEPLGPTGDNALLPENYRLAGRSIVKALLTLADTTSPLEVRIDKFSSGANINIKGGVPPYSVNWHSANGMLSDTTRLITVGSNGGAVYVQVVDSLGCIFQDSVVIAGSNLLEYNVNVDVFPNPTAGAVTIYTEGANLESVRLYDVTGSVHYQSEVSSTSSTIIYPKLAAGIYLVEVVTNKGVGICRIVLSP